MDVFIFLKHGQHVVETNIPCGLLLSCELYQCNITETVSLYIHPEAHGTGGISMTQDHHTNCTDKLLLLSAAPA